MSDKSNFHVELPENLKGKFNSLGRKLLLVDTIIAVSGIAGAVMLFYLLLFLTAFGTPPLVCVCSTPPPVWVCLLGSPGFGSTTGSSTAATTACWPPSCSRSIAAWATAS